MTIKRSRTIEQIVNGQATSDGAGVSLLRVLGGPNLQKRLDPYLLFDHFGSDDPDEYIAGFPDHPHRGIETITLMCEGRMRHNDSRGGEGVLKNGGVQWMIAGEGIIHSEMPEQEEGVMEGFQLWLNLPAAKKMSTPWYKDFQASDIPTYTNKDGVNVRVVAGKSGHVNGAHQREITEPFYIEVTIPAGREFQQKIPTTHNAFIYVYQGSAEVEGESVGIKQMGILSHAEENGLGFEADGVMLKAPQEQDEPTKLLIVAGKPLKEPIVQYGPFAMNTKEEIVQAIEDYQEGRLG